MLSKDPTKRPTASQALAHPWLKGRNSTSQDWELKGGVGVLAKLRDFQAGSKLRQAALHLITSQFTPISEQRHIRDVFIALDTNKDGRLSKEELISGFKMLNLGSELDVSHIMSNCDIDGSGYIELTEFLTATLNWKRVLDPDLLETAFNTFDRDGDGQISAEELRFVLEGRETVGEDVWERMAREGGGTLGLREFREIMGNGIGPG
jgi:calcium-dependent protein kinase